MNSLVTKREFKTLMKGLKISQKDGPFAVATSGGPDSMALSLLMSKWGDAHYLTFDHGLREGSDKEAEHVSTWLKARSLSHTTLKWQGKKPDANIQATARNARYQALNQYCAAHKIRFLFLAHTLDDQAETFLIRLFRGSGIDGLSAMAQVTPSPAGGGVQLVRPLLSIPKTRLKATCKAFDQEWIEDPSNQNIEFTRVKVRSLLRNTDIDGLDAETLAKTAARMARAKGLLEKLKNELLARAFQTSGPGQGTIDTEKLTTAHEEIGLRALSRILMQIGGAPYPPRLEKVERLWKAIGLSDFKGATLAGCQLGPCRKGKVEICREAVKSVDF